MILLLSNNMEGDVLNVCPTETVVGNPDSLETSLVL